MKSLKTLFTSCVISGMLYAGLFMDNEGALNIGLFLIWGMLFIGAVGMLFFTIFLVADDDTFKTKACPEKYVEPRGFTDKIVARTFIICNIGMLVASGYFVTGGLYTFNWIVILILHSAMRDKAKRILGTADVAKA